MSASTTKAKKSKAVATGAKPGPRPIDGKTRDRLMQVRMTNEVYEEAEELAERYGMTVPDWVRARIRTDKAGA